MSLLQVKLVQLGKSLGGLNTVGYAILNSDGSTQSPRTTSGVYELTAGSGIYGAFITLPDQFNGSILWDSGQVGASLKYAAECQNFNEGGQLNSGSFLQSATDTITSGVWDIASASHTQFNTMGALVLTASHTNVTASVSVTVDVPSVVSGVWNANASTFNALSTMGSLQNTITVLSSTLDLIQKVEVGTWRIEGSQIAYYTSGTMVEVARFNLRDSLGAPIDPLTQSPFRRDRV